MSSAKEREILERQRRLAAQMGGGGATTSSSSSASAPSNASKSKKQQPPKGEGWMNKSTFSGGARARPRPPPPPGGPRRSSGVNPVAFHSRMGETIDLTGDSPDKAAAAGTSSAFARPKNRSRPRPPPPPPPSAKKSPESIANRAANTATAGGRSVTAADVLGSPADKKGAGVIASTTNMSGKSTAAAAAAVASTALKRAAIRNKTPGAGAAGAASGSSTMKSLLKSAGHGLEALQSKPTVHYPKVEQEDFWRTIRDWDFVREFNEQRKGSSGSSGSNGNGDNRKRPRSRAGSDAGSTANASGSGSRTPTPTPPDNGPGKPLPDTFDSARQYIALWAPLCLNEAKAQLLSEAISDIPYWSSKKEKGPFPVLVEPLKRDIGSGGDHITVMVRPQNNNMTQSELERVSPSFKPNDVVVLVRDESTMNRAAKGSLEDSAFGTSSSTSTTGGGGRRLGIVGHTESTRRTVDGLWIKVSRKHWTSFGRKGMCLVNIGSNITALREFNALCRVPTIPLINYMLGKDLVVNDDDMEFADGGEQLKEPRQTKKTKSKANMMQRMGGSSALGKGFVAYAKEKFNPSQLLAISASAAEYGEGGLTLIKGPPGTGKSTTLVAILNSLHIRQFNKYYSMLSDIAKSESVNKGHQMNDASRNKPRLLVCAPSNAAVDNVILKIMKDGFIDGQGTRYNPSIVRVGVGQSEAVQAVSLEAKVDAFLSEARDAAKIEAAMNGYRSEMQRIQQDIFKLRKRIQALSRGAPYPLSQDWEARIDENDFDIRGTIYFVNHKTKTTTYECPPPPEPGEAQYPISSMPEFRTYTGRIVKLVERHNSIVSKLEKYKLAQSLVVSRGGARGNQSNELRMMLETHFLDETHIVFTTLGTAGNKALESAAKFEVVVIDEAAQSVEPSTLVGLQLGSKHAILVGDPQQLPATIFSYSGRETKYDRSLFQRLEEAGHEVHLLNQQYRMHPSISSFPRRIFYGGELVDGPNVQDPQYGMPLSRLVSTRFPAFQPLTVLDLDSSEERGGTSLSNSAEARLAIHLYESLKRETGGVSSRSRVAVITPYAQQASTLRRMFSQHLGSDFPKLVEINTVDAFQGREANIVIFSCVRAAGSKGIGFLSDVRRMNVAITRAKHFLFVIARCKSIVVNPYWRDFVRAAQSKHAVVPVPMIGAHQNFPDLRNLTAEGSSTSLATAPSAKRPRAEEGEIVTMTRAGESDQQYTRALDALKKIGS